MSPSIDKSSKAFDTKSSEDNRLSMGVKRVERVGSNSHKKVLTVINLNRFLKVVVLQLLKMLVTLSSIFCFLFLLKLCISDSLAFCNLKRKIN